MTLDEAFPVVDFACDPGKSTNYVVQLRRAKRMSAGGIILSEQDRNAESDNTTVGKVVAIGRGCFRDKEFRPWPEGPWFELGEYLRIPRYGGMRFKVSWKDEHGKDEYINFVMFEHLQFLAKVPGDPLRVIDYV